MSETSVSIYWAILMFIILEIYVVDDTEGGTSAYTKPELIFLIVIKYNAENYFSVRWDIPTKVIS